tara:strand:- start:2324 stop:2506 length:183 start_codon:yes stop_codon:yes gene_type:complete
MPFKSEAQKRYLYANNPKLAKKWEAETGSESLPERLSPKKVNDYKPKKNTIASSRRLKFR